MESDELNTKHAFYINTNQNNRITSVAILQHLHYNKKGGWHKDLGLNPEEGMGDCKCLVPLRYRNTLNSRRARSSLVKLVEGEERWETPDHPKVVLLQNLDGTEPKRTVT
ncbi:hypothetical protein TNCV_5133121 [Trichonephila clavipes]|nr:hypothetical protein TNCV_5133121 [Trichonephila clavipes]